MLGCYGCIFHGTGNSAQLCQNFGISGGGVWTPQIPPPPVRHCMEAFDSNNFSFIFLLFEPPVIFMCTPWIFIVYHLFVPTIYFYNFSRPPDGWKNSFKRAVHSCNVAVLPTACWLSKLTLIGPASTWSCTSLQRMRSHPHSFPHFSLTVSLLLQECRCWRSALCRVTTVTCCSSGCMAFVWAASSTPSRCSRWKGWSPGTSPAHGASCRARRPSPCWWAYRSQVRIWRHKSLATVKAIFVSECFVICCRKKCLKLRKENHGQSLEWVSRQTWEFADKWRSCTERIYNNIAGRSFSRC